MKDYYYILGVPPDATEQQIKTAYKKLSILFHPDKNGGDKFFEDRFKEIQEAYQAIAETNRRENYNQQLNNFHQPDNQNQFNAAAPIIRTFDVSKKLVAEGELITLTWNVQNADSVHVSPIGLLDTSGTKTIRLPNLVGRPLITLTLIATNTFIQQSIEKQIVIENKNFKNKPIQYLQEKNIATNNVAKQNLDSFFSDTTTKKTSPLNKNNRNSLVTTNPKVIKKNQNQAQQQTESSNKIAIVAYLTIIVMVILGVIMAYYVYHLNALKP
jgi:curved DNA-binding protein CbpA